MKLADLEDAIYLERAFSRAQNQMPGNQGCIPRPLGLWSQVSQATTPEDYIYTKRTYISPPKQPQLCMFITHVFESTETGTEFSFLKANTHTSMHFEQVSNDGFK